MPHQAAMSTPDGFRRWARRVAAVFVMVAVVLCVLPASADEIFRNGQSQPATILRIEDGELIYRAAAGGERSIPLGEIESLKLDDEEAYFEALEAFEAENYRKAQRMFGEIVEQTRLQWIRHFAQYYLVQSMDHRGDAIAAAQVYVELARDGADPFFLTAPPVLSLEEATDNQRTRIREEVLSVLDDTEGATREQLSAYLLAVVGEAAMPDIAPVRPGTAAASDVDRSGSAVFLPSAIWELLEAEDFDAEKWACLTLLREGKYAESIEAIQPWLSNPSDMPEKLFILGRAQLALADASGDRDDYLDAGLSFMRIVVHYEKLPSCTLIAPARLEVAYLHRMIDRSDLYEKLLFDSSLSLSFADDPETFPQYYQRYYEIIGEPLPELDDAE